ncbi:TPA: hypothetical protein DEP96_00425 [Candidatus Uhrbacteria bacterium]|nr:hypothetical protein [Candidatus Uhrbacteria bacterium]
MSTKLDRLHDFLFAHRLGCGVTALALGLLGGLLAGSKGQQQASASAINELGTDPVDLKDWPTIPVHGSPPRLGLVPKLPQLISVPTFKSYHDWLALRANFLALVEGHPDVALAWDLGSRIRAHKVVVQVDANLPAIAIFDVMPLRLVRGNTDPRLPSPDSFDTFDIGGGELGVEMYTIHPDLVSRARDAADTVLAFVVISHEYQHQQQFEAAAAGSLDRQIFRTDLPEAIRASEAGCAIAWQHELAAYRASSLASWAYGYPTNHHGLDATVQDEAAFSQSLFHLMSDGESAWQYAACLPILAKLAGHPHPDAFQ